jgi:hypothetical protein
MGNRLLITFKSVCGKIIIHSHRARDDEFSHSENNSVNKKQIRDLCLGSKNKVFLSSE